MAALPVTPEGGPSPLSTVLETRRAGELVTLVDNLLRDLLKDGLPRNLILRIPDGTRFDPREIRLSEAGGCPRRRAAAHAGLVEPEETTEWNGGYFLRGRLAEMVIRTAFASRFPSRCRYEVPVHHPWGTGHADLWFPAEKLLLEIKSATTDASGGTPDLPRAWHLAQLQAYLHFLRDPAGHRRTEHAILCYILLGQRVSWRMFPVLYRPEVGAQIESTLTDIHRRATNGTALDAPQHPDASAYGPPCVLRSAHGDFTRCPLWDHCWTGIKRDETIEADPELSALITEYAALYREKKAAEAEAEQADRLMKTMQEKLEAAYAALDAKRVRAAGVTITRSPRNGRKSIDTEAAIAAGAIEAAALEPFTSNGNPYVTWLVRDNP